MKSRYVLDTAKIRLGDKIFTQDGDIRFFPTGKYYILEGRVYLVEPLFPAFFKLTYLYSEHRSPYMLSDLDWIMAPVLTPPF